MAAGDIRDEAKRLLELHKLSSNDLIREGLSANWSAEINEALSGPPELHPRTVLPLLGEFVKVAGRLYSPEAAAERGVDVVGETPGKVRERRLSTPDDTIADTADRILFDAAAGAEPREFRAGAGKSSKGAIIMSDGGANRHPLEIEGYDAIDNKTTAIDCMGLSTVSCDEWRVRSYSEVIDANVKEVHFEEQVDKDKDTFSVHVRLWKITKHSSKEHSWTYRYKICCCRWAWGAFRFPGDCVSCFELLNQKDVDVPNGPIQRDLVFEETFYVWSDEILKMLRDALKAAAGKAGADAGAQLKPLIDPLVEKAGNEVKGALGLPTGASGSAAGGGAAGSGGGAGGSSGGAAGGGGAPH